MPPVVVLHIGAPKSGTTFVQTVLWANRERLARDGVLLPGQLYRRQARAVRAVLAAGRDDPLPGRWRRLTSSVAAADEDLALISSERLCSATAAQVSSIVDSLSPSRVRVVHSARDIARSVPAQWQSSIRQGRRWTLGEYTAGVTAAPPSGSPPAEVGAVAGGAHHHFWARQNHPEFVRRWASHVGLENVSLVTVPPTGSPPEELWRRFCTAAGLDATAYDVPTPQRESLGGASVELLRRLNDTPEFRSLSSRSRRLNVNAVLAKQVLARRLPREPRYALAADHTPWAAEQAADIIAALDSLDVQVVGDLDDLRPRVSSPESAPVPPDKLPEALIAAAGIDATAGLVAELARRHDRIRRLKRSSPSTSR